MTSVRLNKSIKLSKRKFRDFIIKQVDKWLPFIYNAHANMFSDIAIKDIAKSAFIISPLETLGELERHIAKRQKGAYMRFGDGDIYLAIGKNDLYQKGEKLLSEEMNEAFAMRGSGIFKSLIIHSSVYGYEKEMFFGNHLVTDDEANKLLRPVYHYFIGYKIYSPVALHYAAAYHTELANSFLKLLKSHAILFIGNEDVPEEITTKLFGKVKHVKTPSKHSYTRIDEIEMEAKKELEKENKFGVVIVSMGCSGRVLIKRLYCNNKNIFYFDFGSLLDGIIGNYTRTWLKKTDIDYNLLLKDI